MRRLLFILTLLMLAGVASAQDLPTTEEMQQVLIEGPDWKVVRLKNQILKEQAKEDRTSVNYQAWNIWLLPIYQKLEDSEAIKSTASELYIFLQSGGKEKIEELGNSDELMMQVTLTLMTCYADEEDFSKAEELGDECLSYAKKLDNHHYYSALQQVADIQNKLGKNSLAYKNIKECYKRFDDSQWTDLDVTRNLINTTYFNTLRDLAIQAISERKNSTAKKYLKEIHTIFKDYPETNTAILIDSYLLASLVEGMPANSSISDADDITKTLLELRYLSYLSVIRDLGEDNEYISANDYFASSYLRAAQDAINDKRIRAADIFLRLAEKTSENKDVAERVKEFLLDYSAFFDVQFKGAYIDALHKYQKLIEIREENDDEYLKNTYLNFLTLLEQVTHCVRYFYAYPIGAIDKQDTEEFVPVLPPAEVSSFLDAWAEISSEIENKHGKGYLNSLLFSFHHLPADQRVFPLYSKEDTKLMKAHNFIRNKEYENAFSIISMLISDNSLSNDKIIDLIWRIDNNLYLHSGYLEADDFLQHISSSDFAIARGDVNSWVIRERTRIKDWLSYAIGYAHSFAEEGKIDEAIKEYDIIVNQIQGMENRDSLYLEVQLTRAIDLYTAQDYDSAMSIALDINNRTKNQNPVNYLLRSNALWLISECHYKSDRLTEARSVCEENLLLLNEHPVDNDESHLKNILLDHGDICLALNDYSSAQESYLLFLNKLSQSELTNKSTDYELAVSSIAQLYGEQLRKAISDKDGFLCLSIYSKAAGVLSKYKTTQLGYHGYFDPYDNQLKEVIGLISSDEIYNLGELVIDLDSTITEEEYAQKAITSEEREKRNANVLNVIANDCLVNNQPVNAIFYYTKAIEYVNMKDNVNWNDFLNQLFTLRAIAYQHSGDWAKSVADRISAFNSAIVSFGPNSEETKDRFFDIKSTIDIALEASTSFVNTIFNDENHPHLSYDDNMQILDLWSTCLNDVKDKYGDSYLQVLQEHNDLISKTSFKEQLGYERPYIASERLKYHSSVYYTEALLNIMSNQLSAFNDSYYRLLENIAPLDENEDVDELRYNIATSLASSLSHAGYYDWSKDVLFEYLQYLISRDKHDFEKAEKVKTVIGFSAWTMMDTEGLVWATNMVSTKEYRESYRTMFYDINELISQLILLSRLQIYSDKKEAKETLAFAKQLMDGNVTLINGAVLSPSIKSMLYDDLAVISDNPREMVEYYNMALSNEVGFDYSIRLNLAATYSQLGELEKSNSILESVLQYSEDNYMEPRWKSTLYHTLINNSVEEHQYAIAQEYSLKRLSIQIDDYLQTSQSLTSQGRNNYWDQHYAQTLEDASSVDLSCGNTAAASYNAALFQKSILMRQKRSIKNNILHSDDEELKKAFSDYNEGIRSMSDSVKAIESYCMYLYSLHPEFVSTFKIPQWQEVKSSLGKNDLAIEFSVAKENTGGHCFVAILLRKTFDTPIIVRLCSYNDLTSAASTNLDANGFSAGLYEDNSSLYNLLWAPIELYLKGVKTIYYAPHDFLNNLNIEVAAKKKGARTIGEQYQLYRVSSTGELVMDMNEQIRQAIIFGDIDYSARIALADVHKNTPKEDNDYSKLRGSMGGSWSRLPNTKREMEGIQIRLQEKGVSTTVYSAEKGTEDIFKSLSSNAPDLLHVATHGFYYTEEEAQKYDYFTSERTAAYNPGIRSGLVFSGGNHAWNGEATPSGSEDGILTADEISGMDLTGTQVLTLSACQTALGDVASDGIYGMQRSFKVAGVNTIIMSLWQVDDEATYMMMDVFYRELANGRDRYEAFKLAQSSIKPWAKKRVEELKKEIESLPEEAKKRKEEQYGGRLYPEYYWAAFVMLD